MTTDLDRKLAEIAGRVERYTSGRYRLTVSAAKMNKDSIPALLRLVALRERQLRIVLFDHRRLSYDSQPDKIMSMFDAAALAALEGE